MARSLERRGIVTIDWTTELEKYRSAVRAIFASAPTDTGRQAVLAHVMGMWAYRV